MIDTDAAAPLEGGPHLPSEAGLRTRPLAASFPISALASAWLLFLAFLLAVPVLSGIVGAASTTALLLSVASIVAAGVACTLATLSCHRDDTASAPFRLGPIWVTYYVLTFGLLTLAWINLATLDRLRGPLTVNTFGAAALTQLISASSIPKATIFASLALVAWTGGYIVRPLGLSVRFARRITPKLTKEGVWRLRTQSFPIVVFCVGLAARALLFRADRYAYLGSASLALNAPSALTQPLTALSECAQFGLVLAILDHTLISHSIRSRITLILIFIVELAFGLLSGDKTNFLFTIVSVAIVYRLCVRRLPRRLVVAMVAGALFVIPFASAYRAYVRPSNGPRVTGLSAFKGAPRIIQATLSNFGSGSAFVNSGAELAARLREIDNVALILQKTPSTIPYRPWSELLYGPATGLIPRAAWPSKPVLSTGIEFSHDYYNVPTGTYTANAVTLPGDLLRHGGILPLVAGMFIIGGASRLVDSEFYPGRDPRRVLIYIALFGILLQPEADFISMTLTLVEAFVISVVLTRIAFVAR